MGLFGDLTHVASDVINAPYNLTDRIAKDSKKAFDSAGDAFRSEVHGLASAGNDVLKGGAWIEKQGKLLGEGVLTGAVLNPINGLTQLVGQVGDVHLPKLELSNQAEVNNSWAGKIGTIGGTAADFVLTAGGVSAAVGIEASSATALGTAGAIQGGLLTPTADGSSGSFVTARLEDAFIGGASGAVMGGVAGKVESKMEDSIGTSTADKVKTKFVSGAAGGTASGAVRAESKSVFQTGELATANELSQQVIGGAMTGAAGRVNGSLNESLTDSVAGRMTNSTVASATGGAAAHIAETHPIINKQKQSDATMTFPQQEGP
jgi:hypothetical protein